MLLGQIFFYTTSAALIQEVRLQTYKQPNLLIGKGVWASYVVDDFVYTIKRSYNKDGDKKEQNAKAVAEAKQEIESLIAEETSSFAAIWMDKATHSNSHWRYQATHHAFFLTELRINNYVQRMRQMMNRFLGEGSSENLIDILVDLGYVPGYYYDAKEMTDRISKRIGVDVYPVFKIEEGDNIPLLDYFCLATNLAWLLINHPSARKIEIGMFLFPKY